ncbi:protein NUCLEAR FUSION DEFECTIVE 4-like [Carica papaya]|uniref:protein NUCLEAR FUSION DEFECTIVE 4-like n=1 Tax=Carica papaya TaxID=3649 RepID=UPI000B8CB3AB|nr:protein NUCLEAR FUSION DEFECTIVE 4-like [Carica papaya]
MAEQSRKWMVLVATTWIQAFTGTNFDFSSYSSTLKSVLGISQVQLNYLSVASDMGKLFGWCSGVSLIYFPLWTVMLSAAFIGLVGYGLQWLLIHNFITLPYFLVFLLCLLSGCSICWFNTVCFVLCIRNFPTNKALALSLSISFNGVSAAIYTLITNAIKYEDDTLYLFSNALIPLCISCLTLPIILSQPPLHPPDATRHDSSIFLLLNIIAVITGLYLLFLNSLSTTTSRARFLLGGALFLLFLPLCLPGIVYAKDRANQHTNTSIISFDDHDLVELRKELMASDHDGSLSGRSSFDVMEKEGCVGEVIGKGGLSMVGEEHSARLLVQRWDFWLYYLAYFCGGTIGLVYSNNVGQITQSLGYDSHLNSLVTLYSSCSFFGRLLSAAPDFLHNKVYFARTGWLALAVLPTPIAFFLLAASGSEAVLQIATGLIGLSSGFIFSAAVSITSELFGPNSVSVNHNILITNIPIGSFLYGLLAAMLYDKNATTPGPESFLVGEAMVCMGRQCYLKTFIWWGFISSFGLLSSFMLFLRTRLAYDHLERNRSYTENF